MEYYINCLRRFGSLQSDIKELVPDMNLRRRMSHAVKMGVATALESINEFENYAQVDAIITGTGLGCIADSEKFLLNILSSGEQMLNPTPFIQSTFNTVGAQVALLKSLHCYNNTYSHRYISFESALLEAALRLDSGESKAVLVGVFDENTPTVTDIMKRLRAIRGGVWGEGAVFFVLTGEKLACSMAAISLPEFEAGEGDLSDALPVSRLAAGVWHTAMADALARAVEEGSRERVRIVNDLGGSNNSYIDLRCL